MKKHHLIFALLLSLLFLGCEEDTSTASSTASTALIHNQGQNCATCHNSGTNTSGVVFQTGGTLFDLINAADNTTGVDLSNYTVRLKDYTAPHTVNMIEASNGTGNFYTTETLTGDTYEIEVIEGSTIINSAPDHGVSSLECNSCHTSSGLNGAKGRAVEQLTLSDDVTPLFSACKLCHTVDYAHAYAGGDVFPSNPTASTFLQNATSSAHAGSAAVTTSSTAYKAAYEWIREGANDN